MLVHVTILDKVISLAATFIVMMLAGGGQKWKCDANSAVEGQFIYLTESRQSRRRQHSHVLFTGPNLERRKVVCPDGYPPTRIGFVVIWPYLSPSGALFTFSISCCSHVYSESRSRGNVILFPNRSKKMIVHCFIAWHHQVYSPAIRPFSLNIYEPINRATCIAYFVAFKVSIT